MDAAYKWWRDDITCASRVGAEATRRERGDQARPADWRRRTSNDRGTSGRTDNHTRRESDIRLEVRSRLRVVSSVRLSRRVKYLFIQSATDRAVARLRRWRSGVAGGESRDGLVAGPFLEEAGPVAGPQVAPVVEAGGGSLGDVVDEDAGVVDDVEVVDPDLEGQVDVFARGDLVFFAPGAELCDDLGAHARYMTAAGGGENGASTSMVSPGSSRTVTGLLAAVTAGTMMPAVG
jgi:hypothetical protein